MRYGGRRGRRNAWFSHTNPSQRGDPGRNLCLWCSGMSPSAPGQSDDYFVIEKRIRHRSILTRWKWEILRRSRRLDVSFTGDEYATPQEARLAGEKAWIKFLRNLR